MNITDVVFVSMAILLAATAKPEGRFFCFIMAFEFIYCSIITSLNLPYLIHFPLIALKDGFFMKIITTNKQNLPIFYAKTAILTLLLSWFINIAVFLEYYGTSFYTYDNLHYPIMFALCVVQLILMAANGITSDIIGRIWVSLTSRISVHSLGWSNRQQS